jgi:branched-chain amino acid transport system substrate-binding protein
MVMKKIIFSLVLCVMLGSLRATPAPLTIGAIYNLTGTQSALDVPSSQGALLAVSQINKAGGLLGRPIKLIVKNGQSNPIVINKIADAFAKNPAISTVIGLSDNTMLLAAAPAIAFANKLFLSSGATSPLLPSLFPDNLFLVSFTDNAQASVGAQYAYHQLGMKTVGVVFDRRMQYAETLATYFSNAFQHFGGKTVFRYGVNPSTTANKTILNRLNVLLHPKRRHVVPVIHKRILGGLFYAHIDMVYLAMDPKEVPHYIHLLRQAGFKGIIMGGDSYIASWIIKQSKQPVNNVYFTALRIMTNLPGARVSPQQDRLARNFVKAYQHRYPKAAVNYYAGLGYDTINLLARAIRQADSTKPEAIKKALRRLKPPFDGVMGRIKYSQADVISSIRKVTVHKIENSKLSVKGSYFPSYLPRL